MIQYNEVFELIENGEWDLTDFAVWLNDYYNKAFDLGFEEAKDLYKSKNSDYI